MRFLLHLLELAGKPIFFLFTFIVVLLFTYFQLLTVFTHNLFRSLKRFRLPRFSFHYQLHTSIVIILFLFVSMSSIGSMVYWYVLKDLPSPRMLQTKLPALSTKILARDGTLLYQIYRDENRTLVQLQDLPPDLIQATLASEDKNFYSHRGIDLLGITRALYSNFQGYYSCFLLRASCLHSLQGGSTITQQLVKNALLSPERTLTRKLKEAYLAIWTERLYSKDDILEMYFNYVPYGGTAYGIEEAAHQYFGKSARDLTLPESALLAGLPVAPTTLSPFGTRPYLAKHRQEQILSAMVQMGYLTDNEALVAQETSVSFRPQGIKILAPHFVMFVKDLLVQEFGEDMVSRGGLEVVTTLDPVKQQILETEITRELAKLAKLRVGNAAGLIVSPPTGEILAMVGSRDFFDTAHDGQVNVTLQPRQPGSSIKPVTYTLALLSGLTPNTLLDDSPVCFTIPGQPNYCPSNYDGRFHGRVTLRTALASSYNIPAIKLLNSLGVSRMVSLARELGIRTWDDSSRFGLSLTLGGGEITMYDLSQVYSVFATGGKRIPLTSIMTVRDHTGRVLTLSRPQDNPDTNSAQATETDISARQVIPESVAYQISSILSDPIARAPAFGTRSVLNVPGFQVAVKTGTTNNLRDNWTIGYTPDLLVATWVGNNDNTPMSSVASGITGASPIWSHTMRQLLAGTTPTPFYTPDKMLAIPICPSNGAAYCPNLCGSKSRTEYFVPGTEPKYDCSPKPGEILSGISNN